MKKNINIIQIKGIKGLILTIMIGCCLCAGFIVFPGWVCMKLWDFISGYAPNMPQIGLLQGILLWAIIVASYFTFRKERLIVCLKNPQGLTESELKEVFSDIKKQSQEDAVLQAMLRAREAELKLKSQEVKPSETEATLPSETNNL